MLIKQLEMKVLCEKNSQSPKTTERQAKGTFVLFLCDVTVRKVTWALQLSAESDFGLQVSRESSLTARSVLYHNFNHPLAAKVRDSDVFNHFIAGQATQLFAKHERL